MKTVIRVALLLAFVAVSLGHPPRKPADKFTHDTSADCSSHEDHPGHAAACAHLELHPDGKPKETVHKGHFVKNPIGYQAPGSSATTSSTVNVDKNSPNGSVDATKPAASSNSTAEDYHHSDGHAAVHSSPQSTLIGKIVYANENKHGDSHGHHHSGHNSSDKPSAHHGHEHDDHDDHHHHHDVTAHSKPSAHGKGPSAHHGLVLNGKPSAHGSEHEAVHDYHHHGEHDAHHSGSHDYEHEHNHDVHDHPKSGRPSYHKGSAGHDHPHPHDEDCDEEHDHDIHGKVPSHKPLPHPHPHPSHPHDEDCNEEHKHEYDITHGHGKVPADKPHLHPHPSHPHDEDYEHEYDITHDHGKVPAHKPHPHPSHPHEEHSHDWEAAEYEKDSEMEHAPKPYKKPPVHH